MAECEVAADDVHRPGIGGGAAVVPVRVGREGQQTPVLDAARQLPRAAAASEDHDASAGSVNEQAGLSVQADTPPRTESSGGGEFDVAGVAKAAGHEQRG